MRRIELLSFVSAFLFIACVSVPGASDGDADAPQRTDTGEAEAGDAANAGDAADVGCAGGSGACAVGQPCSIDADCASDSCTSGICTARCGNGRLDEGETCDPELTEGIGECPRACDDGTACTDDSMDGTPEACSARCLHEPVASCVGADGCCPAGCNAASDHDCSTCTDECTTLGATRCAANAVSTCGRHDGDACLEWGPAEACAAGTTCNAGHCETTCVSECTTVGSRRCDETGAVVVCTDTDAHGCLKWAQPSYCPSPQVCVTGSCALACQNECPTPDAHRCVPGATGQVETCAEHDGDGCIEWGGATTCGSGQVCADGACAATCQDGCSSEGSTRCEQEGRATCGDYNSDGCLEWGTAIACAASEECIDGACVPGPPPAKVLINEVLYDSAGSPDTATFVELSGPPGQSLVGFTVVGVNGNGGVLYQSIPLLGSLGPDGLYVVAHTQAPAGIHAAADQLDSDVDYQNGPDAVQVRWGDVVVDAVGYGNFGTSTVFGGEGSAAGEVAAGHSLGRDAAHTDTDDNEADFSDQATPTPGVENPLVDPCEGVTCFDPPAPDCAGSITVREYLSPGVCDAETGTCDYSTHTTTCVNGQTCTEGACVTPPPTCTSSNCTGCCDGTTCVAVSAQDHTACGLQGVACAACPASAAACKAGVCKDLCKPIPGPWGDAPACSFAPEAECTGPTSITIYTNPGTCEPTTGACTYPSDSGTCPGAMECMSGSCFTWRYRTVTIDEPPRRYACALAYDATRHLVVLFGGMSLLGEPYADTWVWDGLDWVRRYPSVKPSARYGFAMANDVDRQRIVLFGGRDGTTIAPGIPLLNPPFEDLWEWDGTTWALVPFEDGPSRRVDHAMVYDAARQRIVLFGGFGGSSTTMHELDDTWEWDGANWTLRTPAVSPPGRHNHAMAYDSIRQRTVLFGGEGASGYLDDTWEWNGTDWVERDPPVARPSPRSAASMAYDVARQRVVLFGGFSGSGLATELDDHWEWTGAAWYKRTPPDSLGGVGAAAMAYDEKRGQIVHFGGQMTTYDPPPGDGLIRIVSWSTNEFGP